MSTPLLKNTCERTSLESCLDRITDLGIAAVLFVAPLVMAGRFAPGRLVLAILVCVVGISWCVARWAAKQPQISWRWTQAEGIVLLACAVVLAQLVPLSADIIQFVSPGVANLLPIHFWKARKLHKKSASPW